jgi:methylenetetrahydrofolate dehydrogenase (NADP+)/methenyltetrahydrofolate cyclohydrolase
MRMGESYEGRSSFTKSAACIYSKRSRMPMGRILDGKAVAQTVRAEVARQVEALRAQRSVVPGLATVLVGDDPASHVYVGTKEKACAQVGIRSFGQRLAANTPTAELLALIEGLNVNPDVHGILVQLPLPEGIDGDAVVQAIAGRPGMRPCTPLGIMRLIAETGSELRGAAAVVIGRSLLVGKPVALLLLEQHATVTLCHSRTRDLGAVVRGADIVVAAIGRAEHVRGEWIKDGAVVIDVGINRTASGGLVGDVEFAGASARAAWTTPVPGGVGPMTVAMLLANTVTAATESPAA